MNDTYTNFRLRGCYCKNCFQEIKIFLAYKVPKGLKNTIPKIYELAKSRNTPIPNSAAAPLGILGMILKIEARFSRN